MSLIAVAKIERKRLQTADPGEQPRKRDIPPRDIDEVRELYTHVSEPPLERAARQPQLHCDTVNAGRAGAELRGDQRCGAYGGVERRINPVPLTRRLKGFASNSCLTSISSWSQPVAAMDGERGCQADGQSQKICAHIDLRQASRRGWGFRIG